MFFVNVLDLEDSIAYEDYYWYDGEFSNSTAYGENEKGVLMQFTGLLDKVGKEIYESDYLGDWCVIWGSGKYILHNISTGDIADCDEKHIYDKEITGNRLVTPREHTAKANHALLNKNHL